MTKVRSEKFGPKLLLKVFGIAFFAYLFLGFMLLPCLNTLASIFNTTNAAVDENGAVSIAYPGIDETTGHLTDATGENGEELSLATFTSITFDENTGLITGISDDTKETVTIGCIAIGRVTNPNGVTAMGNSYYKAGAGSGDLMINVLGGNAQQMGIHYVNGSLVNDGNNLDAGGDGLVDGLRIRTGGEAKLKASGLEQSKADLAQEIANMIVTQRGYQANTRIITVTDSMLEELVNMKR